MGIKKIKGYIFNSDCTAIVNTVNCEGFMGKGLALEFKYRFPEMFIEYEEKCKNGKLQPGILHYRNNGNNNKWVINFPTKNYYRFPSKLKYITDGLEYFINTYKNYKIKSVAFPLLGTSLGGLDENLVRREMEKYLDNIDIDVEIYEYDKEAKDNLFEKLKQKINYCTPETIGIKKENLEKIKVEVLGNPYIHHISDIEIEKIGKDTIKKLYKYALKDSEIEQKPLF